jgi:hypothetical protein
MKLFLHLTTGGGICDVAEPKLTIAICLATILCNSTVRDMLINYGRVVVYSNAAEFPIVSGIRAAYKFMKSGQLDLVSLFIILVLEGGDSKVLTVYHD